MRGGQISLYMQYQIILKLRIQLSLHIIFLLDFLSSAVSGASERNLTSAKHTIALYSNGFDGDFIVEGSMESTANTTSHTEWFHIKLDGQTNDYVSLTNTTTIASYNFTSMAKWIRIIYLPTTTPDDVGKITKVLVRN